jgi:hypothetical protein
MKNSFNEINNEHLTYKIICRSLYILKKKFEIYKNEINTLYTKYFVKDKNDYNNISIPIIKITSFKDLLKEIFHLLNISIFKMSSMNELFLSNFIPESKNEERLNIAIDKIYNFIIDKIRKYNEIFYNKKIKTLIEINKIEEIADDFTDYYPIVEYDKKGRLINIFDEIKILNKENIIKSKELTLEDEYELNIKEENILYIETLPVIIADFIQSNPKYTIINTEINDTNLNKEIKDLFDGEIIKKIEEDNKELSNKMENLPEFFDEEMKIRNILKEQNAINNKIHKFQQIIHQKKKNKENIKFLEDYLNILKKEKEMLIDRIKKENNDLFKKKKYLFTNKSNMNSDKNFSTIDTTDNLNLISKKDESQNQDFDNKSDIQNEKEFEENLFEIFYFYAFHENLNLDSPTFDNISYRKLRLNFDEFTKFLIDFNVKIKTEILTELYKRNSINNFLTFEQFKQIYLKLGLPMNNYRKGELLKKIKYLNEKINELNEEDKDKFLKEYMKNKPIEKEKEIIQNQIIKIENEYTRLNNLNHQGCKEEFDKYIGIKEPEIYREKMKGFLDLKDRFNNKIENSDIIHKKPVLLKYSKSFFKNSIRKELIDKRKQDIENNIKLRNIIQNKNYENENIIGNKNYDENSIKYYDNENILDNEINKSKENRFIHQSRRDKEKELLRKKEEEIELKKQNEIEKQKQLEQEENERKKQILLKQEMKHNIFWFDKIKKSSLKDIDVDINDEKLKLIDSESENSDNEILNRYGNLYNNEGKIIQNEKKNKEIINKESEINNLNQETINKESINDNEKNINQESLTNNVNNIVNNKETEVNNLNNDNNNFEKQRVLNQKETRNRNQNKLNNNSNLSITIDNSYSKKRIFKSPSNLLYPKKNSDNIKYNIHPISSTYRNNNNNIVNENYKNFTNRKKKNKSLINAGKYIISQNGNSFNEQLTSFFKPKKKL